MVHIWGQLKNNHWVHPEGKIYIGWSESDTNDIRLDETHYQIL